MKRLVMSLWVGLVITVGIVIFGDCIVFIRLLIDGYRFKYAVSNSFNLSGFWIALYGGGCFFLLTLLTGRKRRPPH